MRIVSLIIPVSLMFCTAFIAVQNYSREYLSGAVNSQYPELNPRISPDGKKLLFIRENDPANSLYPIPGTQDVWMSKLDDKGEWGAARHLNAPFNQIEYNAVIGFSTDGNTRYIKGYFDGGEWKKSGFSYTQLTRNGWSEPKGIRVKNYDNLLASNTTVTNYMHTDNQTLLMSFTGKRAKTHDIYVSFKTDKSNFTEPMKIGLCTDSYDEFSPFLASDGLTLYFSTDRPGGYGNADIWMSRRLDDTWMKWSDPVNLGPDINTKGWDAYYSIPASGDVAYMVSEGKGGLDICKIKLKEEVRPNPVVLVKGRVLNKKTNQPVSAEIMCQLLPEGTSVSTANSNEETGEYQIILPYGKNYGFNASAEGFYAQSENLDVSHLQSYSEIQKDLYLIPVEEGQIVRLNNIFFEFGKADLKSESFPELDRVVEMMNNNPTIRIEIAGHTDNIGNDADNKKLSEDRAASVRNYIVNKGVSADRVTSAGYGETRPVADNQTEEGRALNRRVEFSVTGK